MKILHIHSDKKFLYLTKLYSNPRITNTIVFLGAEFNNSDNIIFYPNKRQSYRNISKLAQDYDVVVFMSLCLQHALICNQLPASVKVIWRFFGGELYPYIQKEILTETSIKYYRRNSLHALLSYFKNSIIHGDSANGIFWRAVKRIDYMMCLSIDEYEFLKAKFKVLPKFLQVPYRSSEVSSFSSDKHRKIIIGHSMNIDGNHLDILDAIVNSTMRDNYQYVMFFSYSEYSKEYSDAVLNKAKEINSMKVVRTLLPIEEFNNIQRYSSALVINAKRQIAMGNIFAAICNGIKIYLHPDNVMFKWFIRHGIMVYPSDQLSRDLKNNNVMLQADTAEINLKHYNELSNVYSVKAFHTLLLSLDAKKN